MNNKNKKNYKNNNNDNNNNNNNNGYNTFYLKNIYPLDLANHENIIHMGITC